MRKRASGLLGLSVPVYIMELLLCKSEILGSTQVRKGKARNPLNCQFGSRADDQTRAVLRHADVLNWKHSLIGLVMRLMHFMLQTFVLCQGKQGRCRPHGPQANDKPMGGIRRR
ncbi:hypothetical protein F5X96DRAFT_649924 [Biscogniauxia mediterranea]|nr:hypothetical protein F5X96DRAFT_649924 [Biscogniauxia mediterranea]